MGTIVANHKEPANTTTKLNRKPTIKQQKAIEHLVANGGTVSAAMRKAGYSEAMARNPQKLTESDYVQALMQEVGLTDTDAFKQLRDGLEANKVISAVIVRGRPTSQADGEQEPDQMDDFIEVPDHATRHKYLETLLRIRGIGRQVEGGTTNFNFINLQDKDQGSYGV